MAKGIIIDVGFQADIKDFINDIENDFKKVDFDDIIGLSESFDEQAKEIRQKLSKLKQEIDDVVSGKNSGEFGSQLQSLNKAVGILTSSFKELVKNVPGAGENLLPQLNEITSEVTQLSGLCNDAGDAIQKLQKTANGDIKFVDSNQKKELEDTYKLLERAVEATNKMGFVKNKHGNTQYKDSEIDEALEDLKSAYRIYATKYKEIDKVYADTSLSEKDKIKALDELNAGLLNAITNLDRMMQTYEELGGDLSRTSIFQNKKNTLANLRTGILEILDESLQYISQRKAEIQQAYSELGGGDLSDLFLQGRSKEATSINVPLKLTKKKSLYTEALDVIKSTQEKLVDSPLEVEVKLISSYKTQKNRGILKEIKDGLQNIDDDEIKNNVLSLIDKMSTGIDNALLFNVDVNVEKAATSIKTFMEDATEALDTLCLLEPEIVLTPEHIEAFKKQLDDAKGDFSVIQIGIMDGDNTIDQNATKNELTYLDNLRSLIERVTEEVTNKSLAFIEEEQIVKDIVLNERDYLNQLYSDLILIEAQVTEIATAFELIPSAFKIDFDESTLKMLNDLANPDALSDVSKAMESISSALSSQFGGSIEIPEIKKQELLNDINELASEISKKLFETEGLNKWTTSFISSLDEIGQKVKTLFGNNALSDMLKEWNYADEMIKSKKGDEGLRERSAVIDDKGNIYGAYAYDDTGSTRFISSTRSDLTFKGINPKIGIHSHGSDRIVASSIPQDYPVTGGDLGANYYSYLKGMDKQLTVALNEVELFDAKGFYESNSAIDFSDENIQELIRDKSDEIMSQFNDYRYQFFDQFVHEYGSNDGRNLKELFGIPEIAGFIDNDFTNIKKQMIQSIDPDSLLDSFFNNTISSNSNSLAEMLSSAVYDNINSSELEQYCSESIITAAKKDLTNRIEYLAKDLLDDAFGISDFKYYSSFDDGDRDLFTYNFRLLTPQILSEALKGTGYNNDYSDFMKVYSTEDFIKQNPLGLSSGSLSELFDKAIPTNFLDSLDTIVNDLNEIKNFSFDGLADKFNFKIDEGSLKTFIDEIDRLIESLEKLPGQLTEAFSGLSDIKSGGSVNVVGDKLQSLNSELEQTLLEIDKIKKELVNFDGQSEFDEITDSKPSSMFNGVSEKIQDATQEANKFEESLKNISLYKNIAKLIKFNNLWSSSGNSRLREQTMAANIDTGYATRYKSSVLNGTTSKVVDEVIQSATEEINTLLHSHPNEVAAAFSFDDFEVMSKRLKDGITNHLVASLNDLAMIDISGFTEDDLTKISEKMKSLTMDFLPGLNTYAVKDDESYATEFTENLKENVLFFFDTIFAELKKSGSNIDFSSFRKKLESISNDGLSFTFTEDTDSLLEKLYEDFAKTFNIDDKNIFSKTISVLDSKIHADFQERMLKQAIEDLSSSGQLSSKINFDDIYKKFSLDDFGKYLLSNIENTFSMFSQSRLHWEALYKDDGYNNKDVLENMLTKLKEKRDALIQQIESLKKQGDLSGGQSLGGIGDGGVAAGFQAEGGAVNTIIDGEIGKLDALKAKLGEVTDAVNIKTDAFVKEGNVVGGVLDSEAESLDPLKNLESTYTEFKKFYDNNDLESEAGAQAALAYYNAYKEALESKVNKKELQQYTVGKTDDLFTGNYTNYKKGVGDLDLSGLNSQIAKYQEIIDKLNQPEVINAINELTEAIQKLLDSRNNSDTTAKLLENLNKVINNLGNKNSIEKVNKVVTNLENFKKSIETLNITDNGFLQSLSSILEKGEELKSLGEVLKATKKQIDAAGKAVKSEENFAKAQEYLEKYETDIKEAINQKHAGNNETVLYQRLQATKDGLVQIVALIKDANDQYKQFVYTTTDGSDLKVKSTLSDGDPALNKQIKQWETYQKLRSLAVPGASNLGQEAVTFTPESDNWQQLIDKAAEFGIKLEDIKKIIRTVDQLGNESFQIFTDLSRITIGMDSNGVLFQKDEVLDATKLIQNFENQVQSLGNSLNASFKNDMGTNRFLNTLKSIQDTWQDLLYLKDIGIVSEDQINVLKTYYTSFLTSISSFTLDKFKDARMPGFTNQVMEARTQLDAVIKSLEKLESGEAFTQEDLKNVDDFINRIRELNKAYKDTNNKFGNTSTKNNLIFKIADYIEKNSAMPLELKQNFQSLSTEIQAFGDNLPADRLKQFVNEFTNLKAEVQQSGKTGLSFFDNILKKAKEASTSFISMYLSLYDIIRYIRSSITTITELDTAFTEMRKVSDESVSSLKAFQEASFDIAGSVGTTAQQIQNSTADFMRLGESLEEASKSAEVANILLNVSEFESIDEATESLTAMSAAYEELDKLEIVDKLNNIGNNYSISTDGLATALQKSASALKTAGNDLDEANAIIVAGNQIVQDPESVGAGIRTIALRITGTASAKEELEELGEDTSDFVVQTSAKSQQAIKDFTRVASNNFQGFDILDDNGNFKSTYEILLGISEIYDEVVATDKQYGSNMANGLLETLAGILFCQKSMETYFYRTHLIARIA